MSFILDAVVLLVTVLSVAIGGLYIFFQIKYRYWSKKNVPHPKPSFPLGNLQEFGKVSFGEAFRNLYDRFKHEKFFGMWQMHQPSLVINDPELIKKIMVGDFMSFHDRPGYTNEKDDPLSVNLVAIRGAQWKNLRAKLSPTFTSGKMKLMFPIMSQCGDELVDVLKNSAEKEEVIEAKEIVARFTTDVISSCAFGIETNSLKNPDAIFRKMGRRLFEPSWSVTIKNLIGFMMPDLAALLRLVVTPRDITKFFLGAIKETMEYRETKNVRRNDVLQLLMELKNKGVVDSVDSDKKLGEKDKFTFELAAAQAFVYFIGGFETSSTTLQFALYELALNQKLQDKVREEITETLSKNGGKMSYENVHGMDLVGRIIDETLRKYPPGAFIARQCTRNYPIPDTDVVVDKGTTIIIPAYGVHMDERYFPNPEKFDPDRFTEEQKRSRHHYTYLPFGEGPRVCIGSRFGLMQTRVALVSLLSHYKFDISPRYTPVPMVFDPKAFIFTPKGGMNLKISKI